MKNLKITIALFLIVTFTSYGQNKIDPNLLDEIKKSNSTEDYFSVIIMLNDQVDANKISEEFQGYTREVIHKQVVMSLQSKANTTQLDLVNVLTRYKAKNDVKDFKKLWIINAIIVTAKQQILYEIEKRNDVAYVYLNYQISQILPIEELPSPGVASAVEPGLELINADCLWAQGITGNGRIVSNLDTGVDGNHPALLSKFRGSLPGVTLAETWFDPNGISPFPDDSGSHGTHTMGTIVGSTPGNIIGVAYDAKWIAAAVIDIGGISSTIANALLAFQWSADPDGNPATVSDVPDVSSNSWGLSPIYGHVPAACDITFWSAIDNLEAATVMVVFAAGNEGSGASTLRTPADRITTLNNAFSVGSLDVSGNIIASYSSRGPSLCSGTANQRIKPEIVARGTNVRSSIPNGGYAEFSGTSMATPHIAGAVALLRQVNPNATVNEIKTALMQSASDLGTIGEDNNYGHGLVDVCLAATLINNCQNNLTITTNVIAPTADMKQASNTIVATNTINSNASAIYHAGNSVVLKPLFNAKAGSKVHLYVAGCTNTYIARFNDADNQNNQNNSNEVDFSAEERSIVVAPNPNNGLFRISLNNVNKGHIEITDTYGFRVFKLDFIDQKEFEINLQQNKSGIYIVKVISEGDVYTAKIIKN